MVPSGDGHPTRYRVRYGITFFWEPGAVGTRTPYANNVVIVCLYGAVPHITIPVAYVVMVFP